LTRSKIENLTAPLIPLDPLDGSLKIRAEAATT
jgi:hypothetical protein